MEEKKESQDLAVEKPNSVEISVNAKGQYSGKVKVYGKTIEDAYSLAIDNAEKLEKLIASKNGGEK